MLNIWRRTSFLENTTGELLLYIVRNIEVMNVEVLSKKVKKLLQIRLNIIKTFFNFIRDFRLVAKD